MDRQVGIQPQRIRLAGAEPFALARRRGGIRQPAG